LTSYEQLLAYPETIKFPLNDYAFRVGIANRFPNDKLGADAFVAKYAITEEEKQYPAYAYWRVSLYIASAEIDNGKTINEAFALATIFFEFQWDMDLVIGGRIMYGAGNPNKVSLNNCTSVLLEGDTLEDIWAADYKIGKVESRGEGVGMDMSPLRPRGTKVNNAAQTTSGAVSWMSKMDHTTATIAQNGRRGALLLSLTISHPDIPEFITVKSDMTKITNANISIQITDDFMYAYLNNEMWRFHWESQDGKIRVEDFMPARDVMRMISENSSKYAEPGLQFWDTISRYSNSNYIGHPVIGTNACSEEPLTDSDACVLGHINWATLPLGQFLAECEADLRAYYLNWFLDNVVTKQLVDKRSPLASSAYKSRILRRVGGGGTGAADYFAKRGLTYASNEANEVGRLIARAMAMGAYRRSIEAGAELGSFDAFNAEDYKKSPFIQEMIADGVIPANFKHMRNVCSITWAPVGTGMLMVQGWANGAEPGLGFIYWRRTRISGEYVWYFTVNPFVYQLLTDQNTMIALKDLTDLINTLEPGPRRYAAEAEAIEMIRSEINYDIHKFSHEIDPMAKVKFIGILQKYNDSAISITFNMPQSTTVEQIEELYVEAWRQKLKGISIYREDPDNRPPIFQFTRPSTYNYARVGTAEAHTGNEHPAVKGYRVRPESIPGYTKKVKAEGLNFYFTYNLDGEKRLYEIFCTTNAKEPKVNTEAALTALHDLIQKSGAVSKEILESQISKASHQASTTRVCRLVSLAIRNGIMIEQIVDALNSVEVTVSSYIFHLRKGLLEYVGTKVENCPSCYADAMVVGGGCASCAECGYSKC
jgi:ribonucleoside-diphosphate reductase alpha chain